MAGFDDPMTLALLGASAGFLDPRGGMMGGFQGAMHGLQAGNDIKRKDLLAQQQQMKIQKDMETRQLLSDTIAKQQASGDMNPASIANALIATGHPDAVQQGFGLLKDFRAKVKTTAKGLDEKGNPVIHNIMDNGETMSTGITPAERLMQVNEGHQITMRNPYTNEVKGAIGVGMSPGENARLAQSAQQFGASHGLAQQNAQRQALDLQMKYDPAYQAQMAAAKAGGKESGANQVKAATELPGVIEQGEQTIKLVDDLLAHPGFKLSVGKSAPLGSLASMVPGTEPASFDIALNQLKGKQFLEAFQSLKGGGAITEVEGEKAQQAMSRMEKSNTEEEFTRASREFQGIIKQGINRAKTKAGVQPQRQQQGGASGSFAGSADGWGELR